MNAAQALEDKIRAGIPLSEAMLFSIDSLSANTIRVSAPLPPNINVHGSGFAGSIYSVAVLTGWALLTHVLAQLDLATDLVVARAEIRYRAPVTQMLSCRAELGEAQREAFLLAIRQQGRASLQLEVNVGEQPEAVLVASFYASRRD